MALEKDRWIKSSLSYANSNCVEATTDDEVVLVRDTKQVAELGDDAPVLRMSVGDWQPLVNREKESRALTAAAVGRTILTHELANGALFMQVPNRDGSVNWVSTDQPGSILTFFQSEIDTWGDGIRNLDPATGLGEFDLPEHLQPLAAR